MKEDCSFRDPDGYIFYHEQHLYRAITSLYEANYNHLIKSGLYEHLLNKGFLIPHKEIDESSLLRDGLFKVIEPERVPFISYPYEWSFSQLKDAALLTLEIQSIALDYGMSLKDASAYNVQFYNGRAVHIDTLSFEMYAGNRPWNAYKQFCQHFLAPIALMGKRDVRLNCLLKDYIDGIPLDLACKLLPKSTLFSLGLLLHLHLHSSAQKRYHSNKIKVSDLEKKIPKNSLLSVINSLKNTIKQITWKPVGTEWGGYYEDGVHLQEYLTFKKQVVSEYIEKVNPESLWDLGANTGIFSRLASNKGTSVIAFDIDPACVEKNYLEVLEKNEKNILPLLLDLTNPSPSLGWANLERKDITARGPVDMIMVLALIHHLAISSNLPLNKIAEYLSGLAKWLVIEFVPKNDEKVLTLLINREDIFPEYTRACFEKEFLPLFNTISTHINPHNDRIMYLMQSKKYLSWY